MLFQAVYSRVARVCKDDTGGRHKFHNNWTTFLKARLNCSVPGDIPFYFDEIQSVQMDADGDRVHALFTTPENAIAGSALCTFSLAAVARNFNRSPFKGQADADSNWLPVSGPAGAARPGQCGGGGDQDADSVDSGFARRHTLMDRAVGSEGGRPVFVLPSLQERLTSLVVVWEKKDLLAVAGTSDGKVLRIVVKRHSKSPDFSVLDSLQVFAPGVPVRSVAVATDSRYRAVAVSDDEVASVPLRRCDVADTCESCRASRDDCVWNGTEDRCEDAESVGLADAVLHCPVVVMDEERAMQEDDMTTTTEVSTSTTTPYCPECACVCPISAGDGVDKASTTESATTAAVANFTEDGN